MKKKRWKEKKAVRRVTEMSKDVKVFVKGISMSGKVKDDDNRSTSEDKRQSEEGTARDS